LIFRLCFFVPLSLRGKFLFIEKMTKKILIIFIFAANLFADDMPVVLAARNIPREGKLQLGIRNTTDKNISGVIKFENAEGVELLANGIGFDLSPKQTEYKNIPVKNTTKDIPVITCKVIIFDKSRSKMYKNKIECKSGALFRDIGVDEKTAESSESNKVRIRTGEKSLISFYMQRKCVIDNLFFKFGDFRVKWRNINSKSGTEFIGQAFKGSNAVANLKLSAKLNNRGDCNIFLNYLLLDFIDNSIEAPEIIVDIPREAAKFDLIALRFNNGKTDLLTTDNMAQFINRNVKEFSVITKNDWMTFYMDSTYLTAGNKDKIILKIKSRTEWKPPFVPKLSGTIQFFIHFPVAVPK